jgi:hypothetical protein
MLYGQDLLRRGWNASGGFRHGRWSQFHATLFILCMYG